MVKTALQWLRHKVQGIEELKIEERRIKTDEICSTFLMDKGIVQTIVEELSHSDVCIRWVHWMLRDGQKERKTKKS